jgi:two-component system OmpR family sensor kinase
VPLRTRLVLLLVFLVAVALVAVNAIGFTSLQNQVLQPVDGELQTLAPSMVQTLNNQGPFSARLCESVPSGTYGNLFSLAGKPVQAIRCSGSGPVRVAPQAVPVSLIRQAIATPSGIFSTIASGRYRVLALPASEVPGGPVAYVFVVSVPLDSVNATLSHQLRRDLVVSLGVLLILAIAAWALVRVGLRPLDRMAGTAGEIAAGDLTKRVEDTDPRTEVGQLGTALNAMLTQIEQAFREREASEAQLRRFVADASHELRTPLTSIRGYAELFRNGTADNPDDLATALRRIESESERMGGLVEDMLLLARLDQGRPLEHDPVDLATLAGDAAQDAGAVDPSREVTLIGDSPVVVNGDDRRLRQVLGNLVANALSHTPPGTPIEIATATSPDGTKATLAVIDHGPGIPDEDLPHVFERFWRADQSRQRAKGGAGLGLAIVAAVVAAHQGVVRAVGTPAGGATFIVELPTRVPAPPAPGAQVAQVGESTPTGAEAEAETH